MPFLGGRRISTTYGDRYANWLIDIFGGTGETDYVGYFFLRARELIASRGTLGFIATDTIAEGENRRTTVARLVEPEGEMEIYRAETGMPWPGNAVVRVATVFMANGELGARAAQKVLNGRRVPAISSRLRAGTERHEPAKLQSNSGGALVGCFLRGDGFILSHNQARELIELHPAERDVVLPFLTGDDLNRSPTQLPSRHVIAFFDKTLDEARQYPAALTILEQRVRPYREGLKSTGSDAEHRKYWWRFANTRQELRAQSTRLPRLLATARVSKHSMFSFISPKCVPSEQVVVFPLASFTAYAVLQSRVHRAWVSLLATHMGEGVRYSAPECFETFPFPTADPRAVVSEVERCGERTYAARVQYLATADCGLTDTYNALSDPAMDDERLRALRGLHEGLDRAVLDAYGWPDIQVPPYVETASGRALREGFDDAVVERLLALNELRASNERGRAARGNR